jgi:multifunctional 2-oxoglutarate metabolism enzyme
MATNGTVQVEMPAMGESVTEGTVLEWLVAEGDEVSEGDTIVEVSTDKVDAEVPAPTNGTITKILKDPDDMVKVGEALAELDPNGGGDGAGPSGETETGEAEAGDEAAEEEEETAEEDEEADAEEADAGKADAEEADAGEADAEEADAGEADAEEADAGEADAEAAEADGGAPTDTPTDAAEGEEIEIEMPEMGESVSEGTVLEWLKEPGDSVEEGDAIVEVSTDKVDAEVPAPAAGTLTDQLKSPDDTVKVGEALARMKTGAAPSGDGAAAKPKRAEDEDGGEAAEAGAAGDGEGGRATPIARRAAKEKGIDLSSVEGTGDGGKVTKQDVLAAAENGDRPSAPAAGAEEKPLRGPSAMLAKAMDESRSIPTATSFRTVAVDTIDAKRKALNGALAERGMKVSFTHLVAWAIVQAAKDWPVMARTFAERDGKPHVVIPEAVNLGIAVDVERKDGSRALLVPSIKGANDLDFTGFHGRYEELIRKTRDNSLTADDFQGTNITLTNPGGIGTVASVPRLMKGQGTIVATGSIAYPVEWSHAPPDKLKSLGVSKVMTMTSTYDHRVIQGAESGNFLKRIDGLLKGEESFYEGVARALEVDESIVTSAHPAAASSPPLAVAGATAPSPATAPSVAAPPDQELMQAVQAATSLLKAYRTHGHLAAKLNPLGGDGKGDPALEPENLNLTPELMAQIPASILRIGVAGETLLDVLPRMRDSYCGRIAYQIEHLSSHQQRMWLREMIETGAHRRPLDPAEKEALLGRLVEVYQFERFIQKAYLGQKMFSVEGLDATVPMIDEAATIARRDGAEEVVLGMAHRGRLSVLAHNLGRPIESIMAEFEGAKALDAVKRTQALRHGGTGDVKYHHGAEGLFETPDGDVKMRLYPNPSHLEFVDPVVTGAARAAQTGHSGPRLHHDPRLALPLLLHGDAAFPGQGVVAETLNLQSLDGYSVGGTVHLIQDNQVGFTTDPRDGRSTPYAADMAKGFNVPIIHVNADDVENCIAAIRLAMAYRQKWGRDIVVDLIGYRRYGHNETDEAAYTQPELAAEIKKHPPVSEVYAKQLVSEGVIAEDELEELAGGRREQLSITHKELKGKIERGEFEDPTVTGTGELDRSKSPDVETKVSEKRLRSLNKELLKLPETFSLHRKLRKPLMRRIEILEEGPIEYGHAEALAFASLLTEGTHIRLTGQDTERGTFSHRHLVLHDEKTGLSYAPIQNLSGALAPFEIHNSPLSETGCLGFEYGYSAASNESLILWEAQFGDFSNAGQVIIDSFIASAESKWGQTTRLTLLLPHGYEGSGPEHSSARIERFLQLAAEGNMRLANPTTAAQYFHLLRRQARIAKARPMVIFTPKGLLRLGDAAAKVSDLTEGSFQFVLDDPNAGERAVEIKRLVLCSGRVYYDLEGHDRRADAGSIAIGRVELIYPFPKAQLAELIGRYPNLEEIVWAQEEPRNMGCWSSMARRLPEVVPDGVELRYVGRPERASPSEGYPAAHRSEQERIVLTALTG